MKRARLSSPVTIGTTEIRVIEALKITRPGRGIIATKTPVAVVIQSAEGPRAFDIGGEEIPLKQLRLRFPHLTELDDV